MRTASSKPFIALLGLAFAICSENAPGQSSQTQPPPQHTDTSQPSTEQQPQHGSPGGDVGGAPETSAKEPPRVLERRPRVLGRVRATLSPFTRSTPPAMSARVQPSPARTLASGQPRAQAKSPRAQAGALANYSIITMRRRRTRLPPNHKTRATRRFPIAGRVPFPP